jgi:hypothetical protein
VLFAERPGFIFLIWLSTRCVSVNGSNVVSLCNCLWLMVVTLYHCVIVYEGRIGLQDQYWIGINCWKAYSHILL